MLSGRVVTGRGEGSSFTQIEWAREQFMAKLGIDPYPGTLNLRLDEPADQARWAELKAESGYLVTPPDGAWCNARCYPVRLPEGLPGAIIYPEVPDYPENQVELIAALSLRQHLALADGDRVNLALAPSLTVRAVIFDVDGTLVDSVTAYRMVAQRAAKPHGLFVSEEVVRHALNTNHPTFWELVVPADHPNPDELITALRQEAWRHWPEVLQQYGGLFPGVEETLTALQQQGLRLAIVTGSRGGSFQPLQEAGLMDYFEVVVTGKDVEQRKPDPEGLLKCLAALGLEPAEALYVGDTPTDIEASRAAGTVAVAVLSGAGDSALLSAAGPDRIIYSLASLPELLA